jgi:hypothetical protein
VVPSVKDERAPVSGGAVLRLEAEVREVAAVQCWSGEGESRRGGERTRPAVVRFPFKGGAGGVAAEGGLVEHGRRVEEVGESEGGGFGRSVGQRRSLGWQRPGRGTRGRRVAV